MTLTSSTSPSTSPSAGSSAGSVVASVLERTRQIVPELRARAEQAANDRRLPVENIEAVRGAGAFKVLQATRNGGLGLGVRDHLDVISTLARGCGSTAWVAGVVHAHSWLLSHFPEQGQRDVYGDNPDAIVSAVIGPRGRATRTSDGYVLEGVWPFASGSERADWLLLGAQVIEDGEVVDEGDFIVSPSDLTFLDDWHVTGLRGTGSCTVRLERLEIPEHRFVSLPAVIMGNSPGAHLHTDDWVQRCAPVPVLTIAICGSALGLAEQALEDFPPLIAGKTIAYTADRQDTHPVTHVRIADAAMRVHEARLLLYHCADELDDAGRAGTELALLTRARMRVDCAVAVRRCLEAVEILFSLSGATGVRTSGPLPRALADLKAINNHGLLALEMNEEMYGRLLMGLEPNTPLI
jgi:3-hydroxy-9,10-secoandrosta-1,3,5(10)-triene-9,17-dione monooxygenase